MVEFKDLFRVRKPIIGMIHLSGIHKVDGALREMEIYAGELVNGVIVEDYHGCVSDVKNALEAISKENFPMKVGVNVLGNPYQGFELANEFGASFVQFDSVQSNFLHLETYLEYRKTYPNIAVLGGVRFKYKISTGGTLEDDVAEAIPLCEAIVTTGKGTGIETPIDKLRDFKRVLGDFPLIVGAGVNYDNIDEQLEVADGAIIGSAFKFNGDTQKFLDKQLVRDIMGKVIYGARRN